jgi:serine/threonine-protein kinase HipA
MPSEHLDRVYVWVWLPGATEPVVAGVLSSAGNITVFRYARSYQALAGAVPLYLPELPLGDQVIAPPATLSLAGCIRDGTPDSWGMRVVLERLGLLGVDDVDELSPFTYMVESGSDRFGAFDFQQSPTEYVPRLVSARLEELLTAADRVDAGEPLSPELANAIFAGSSLGGARPKVTLRDGDRSLVAKFSSRTDHYSVVKAEGAAMSLARRVGLDVAPTEVVQCAGKDVLLVERFDRTPVDGERKMVVSALTVLELHPQTSSRYATYYELADIVRARFSKADATLHELFQRIVFNICVGNTDDHARNHAAFWDATSELLAFTPAYDICPQERSGGEASQAMAIRPGSGGKLSNLANCVEAAPIYHLTAAEARRFIDAQLHIIRTQWEDAADEAQLTAADRMRMWERMVLNPYCREGYDAVDA